ncbi:asparaginase [Herbiconiux sp. L3-i23]|uniref:asparaginase n=1 Tax=Herbiconiux sp. L3-i23 TaxID=2905871 RepID=UPI002050D1E9|nr:asparaginase [Herbiconiux sp. L3-i23]BDI21981.1 L-asparaginase [Herbiconiux sp. L3-i23]
MSGSLPRVAILALGGTIGAPVDATGSNSALAIDAAGLVASIPLLGSIARVEPSTFRTLMSADISWRDIVQLAEHIAALADDGVDGVVVTQGTDTLEESAYLLDLLLPATIPVVVTGAMRNPGKPGADGPANLVDAVRVAARPESAAHGVLVVLACEIHRAPAVRKTRTSGPSAFGSPDAGPIGWIVEDRVRFSVGPAARRAPLVPAVSDAPRVALHRLALGDDTAVLDAIPGLGYDGLVVEVFGAGHVGTRALDALSRASETMPVVFASRTGAGDLYRATGGYPGSETDLLRRGLIPAGALDGLKARLLLMTVLATGVTDRDSIDSAFTTP